MNDYGLYDKIHSGIFILNSDLKVCFWNRWLEIYTGVKSSDIVDEKIYEVFNTIDSKSLLRKVKTSIMLNSPTYYDAVGTNSFLRITNRKLTNKIYDVMVQKVIISPLDNKEGTVIVQLTDFTEAAESEWLLKEREELLNALFEYGSVSSALLDSDMQIVRTNDSFLKLFNLSEKNVLNNNLLNYVFDSDMTLLNSIICACDKKQSAEIRIKSGDNNLWVSVNASKIVTKNGTEYRIVSFHDIQSIKESESKLLKEHQFFQNLLDYQSNMVVVSDGLEVKNCNKSFLDFFGFDNIKDFSEKNIKINEFFLDESGKQLYISENWIYDYYNKEGDSFVFLEDNANSLKTFLLKVEKFPMISSDYIAVFTDVTGIENYQRVLKDTNKVLSDIVEGRTKQLQILNRDLYKSRRQLEMAQEVAGVGSWEYKFEDDTVVCSIMMCKILGINYEFYKMNMEMFLSYFPSEIQEYFLSSLEKCMGGGSPIDIETTIAANDLSEKNIFIHAVLIKGDGENKNILGTVHDITNLRRTEHRLNEREILISSVFDTVNVGICFIDQDKKIERVNREFCRITGFSEFELKGEDYAVCVHENDVHDFFCNYNNLFENEDESTTLKIVLMHKDGRSVETIMSARVVEQESVRSLMAVFTDITEIVKAERTQQEQEKMLIQQSKMAAMGEMIAVIAHQWKQPLSIVSLVVQNIVEDMDYKELTDEILKKYTEMIEEQVRHMNSTIETFRNFFKPSKEVVSFSPVNAVNESISLIKSELYRKNVEVIIDYEPGSENYTAVGPVNEFKQVVLNLLINAKDALVESVDRGSMDRNDMAVKVEIKHINDKIVLSTTDNGDGIPPDVLKNLFKPYVTSKGEKGTGIGLYMASLIIERMKGRIYAENLDRGARFVIELNIDKQG